MALHVRSFKPDAVTKPSSLEGFVFPPTIIDGQPLDLEIGCGVGWHPIRYATENPNRRLIAIEHTRAKFESFSGRVAHHPELTNLLPIHADAIRWVTHALNESSIDRILLLYPNPEPKAENKRWLRSPFFERLLWTLKPQGEVILATNIAGYITEACDFATGFWQMKIKTKRVFTQGDIGSPEFSGIPRTHFEKKYLARGESCYDATFVKR